MMRRRAAAWLLVLGMVAGAVVPARPCGPDLPEAVFVSRQAPDDPKAFASGRIGIPLPSYYQRYLFLAYRALSGHVLQGADLDAALRMPPTSYGEDQPAYARWRAVRDSLGGESRQGYVSLACARQQGSVYYFYPNYYDDAFRSATATLLERTRRQGGADASIRDWMKAQDAVFHACGYDSAPPPAPAPGGSPDWLVKDRAYQSASWSFYSGHFDEAASAFRAIADDRDSPWRDWGAYLAGRAYTRKGTVTPDLDQPNREALEQAEKQFEAVLADRSLSARHGSASRLLAFVRLHLDPAKRLAEVAHDLMQPHPAGDISQEVFDLTALLDRFSPAQAESLAKINPDYEVADWILSFQARNAPHALERWHETASAPWLVAALSAASEARPELLTSAAEMTAPDRPGFWAVQFHSARLLTMAGRDDDARRLLDQRPMHEDENLDRSGYNALFALRMRLAKDFHEFQQYRWRYPVTITGYSWDGETPKPEGWLLDRDGAYVLNRWAPASLVARGFRANANTEPLRVAAWTRAVVLADDAAASGLSDSLAAYSPSLAPYLKSCRAAPDPASRRFEATWLLLHAPGMTPWVRWGVGRSAPLTERELFRDNWWPVESKSQHAWFLGEEGPVQLEPDSWADPPGWDTKLAQRIFSAAERAQAERERAAITQAGPGANFLCQQTVAWAKSHPKDARLPEALHLCVQATRYGYADDATTGWSRQAFTLLHARYPDSPWAKRTKYWY